MKPGLLLLCLFSFACVDRSLGVVDDTNVIVPPDQRPPLVTTGCDGFAPYCVDFCGSDWFQAQSSCENGDWVCPDHLMRVDQCPPNTCWGPPLPGETCESDGWHCDPKPSTYDACPGLICAECTGFGDPVTVGTCTCACDSNNQVRCERAFAPIDPSARFFWLYAGGVVGSGGGVEILGDGTVHGWYPGPTLTSGPPDFTGKIATNDVADLFARFRAVNLSSLPHHNGSAECGVSGSVRDCSGCKEATLTYSVADNVLPEMNAVWAWFDEHAQNAISVSDFSPAQYCAF